jgi:mannose-6-phosphate isomerase-like protein (cupin superfamily)
MKPKKILKPWGYELVFAHTEKYVGKIIHINKGELLSRQYHRKKDESLYVISGRIILEIGKLPEIVRKEISAGEGFHIPPLCVHRFIAPDDSESELIEVSTVELEDVVRIEDRYGREGTD